MKDIDVFRQGWEQTYLEEPAILELTLRIGVIRLQNHAQVQIEGHDPKTKILLSMASWPHISVDQVEMVVARAVTELLTQYELRQDMVEPFPDPEPPGA